MATYRSPSDALSGVSLTAGTQRRLLELDTGGTSGATMGSINGRPAMQFPATGVNFWRSNMYADLTDRIAGSDLTFWVGFSSNFSGGLGEDSVWRFGYAFNTVGDTISADLTYIDLTIDMEALVFDTLYETTFTIPSADVPAVLDSACFYLERNGDAAGDTFPQIILVNSVELRYPALGVAT